MDRTLYPLGDLVTLLEVVAPETTAVEVCDDVEGTVPVEFFFLLGNGGTFPEGLNGKDDGWSLASSSKAEKRSFLFC